MSNISSGCTIVFRIDKLTALREMKLSDCTDRDNNNNVPIVGGIERIRNLSRLQRFHLSSNALTDSDVKD